MKIRCNNDRVFEINGMDVREPEWFPEKRNDIFDVFFTEGKDLSAPRKEAKVGLHFWVDFLTNGPCGNCWCGGIVEEILE